MIESYERLIDQYDRGALSRRALMQGLLLLAMPSAGQSQPQPATPAASGHTVNHVQLQVRDLVASTEFYSKLVGARKERENNESTWALVMPGNPSSVLTLQRSSDRSGVLDHFGIGIMNFDAPTVAAAVKQIMPGADVQVSAGAVPAVGVRDPDGILVQLNPAG